MSRAIIGPRLAARFPHLAHAPSGSHSADNIQTLPTQTADAVSCGCITEVDPADIQVAHDTGSSSSNSETTCPQIREGSYNDSAAVLADAVAPLAAAGATADAPAAVVIPKIRFRPFRIPKRT